MKSAQVSLFEFAGDHVSKRRYGGRRAPTTFGGVHGKDGRHTGRKFERPFSSKRPLHLVLKSDKAVGKYSFLRLKNSLAVREIIKQQARKFGVIIHDFANGGNHLHIKVSAKSLLGFQKFLKSITAMISRKVTGARKGKPFGRFWQGRAFSRVLTSRREELILDGYFEANRKEVSATSRSDGLEARSAYVEDYSEWMAGIIAIEHRPRGQKMKILNEPS